MSVGTWVCLCSFFFQAEDGIRDLTVTGVQTCALPISIHQAELLARVRSLLRVKELWDRLAELNRTRSEEHTSELQSQSNLVCRLLLEKKKKLINSPQFITPRPTLWSTVHVIDIS